MARVESIARADGRMAGGERAAAPAVLDVSLGAIVANYRVLAGQAPRSRAAAVVKADGYGLGAVAVARALMAAGCRSFFVATPAEGLALRAELPDPDIFVLDGLVAGHEDAILGAGLIPVLGSVPEVAAYQALATAAGRLLPAALHFDTGMNRLGFDHAETVAVLADRGMLAGLDIRLVMSHLACADTPEHRLNARQARAFAEIAAAFPGVPASLANSAGCFLGPDYHFDLLRPGIALYGGHPLASGANPVEPVVRLTATVLQVRNAQAGATVGYGATHHLARDSRLATIGCGYADGIRRSIQNANAPAPYALIHGQKAPLVGRISMDLIVADVTDLPPASVQRGTEAVLIGDGITIDDLAARAGTISYEILTGLGARLPRRYTQDRIG